MVCTLTGDIVRPEGESWYPSKILGGSGVEFAFFGFHVKFVFAEPLKDLSDMLFVRGHVLGEDNDVVQINYNANIEEIYKDGVDKLLKSCRGIHKSKQHD